MKNDVRLLNVGQQKRSRETAFRNKKISNDAVRRLSDKWTKWCQRQAQSNQPDPAPFHHKQKCSHRLAKNNTMI